MRMIFAAVVAFGAGATWPAMAQEHAGHTSPMPGASGTAPASGHAMPEMCKSMGMAMGMMGSKMGPKTGGMPMGDTAKAHPPTAPDGKAMSTTQMTEMKMSCGEMMGKDGMMPMGGAMPKTGAMPKAKAMPKDKAMPKGAMPDHE